MQQLFFSSSSRVMETPEWVYSLEEAGYDGWEIMADGPYRLDDPEALARVQAVLETTGLAASVHAPYSDLDLASLNYPIWRESIRQITACITHAAGLTDRVTIHPGYISPIGALDPHRTWALQKEALVEIGKVAVEHGVLACLENMIGVKEFLCRFPLEIIGMTEGIEGVGITCDLGHANTAGQVGPFLEHIEQFNHLHLHDNHGLSDEHLALGDGSIDWAAIGPQVKRRYTGIAVVEGRSLEEARKSAAAFRRWFV